MNLPATPISCANCKHEPKGSDENPCLHCFDKVTYKKKDNQKLAKQLGRTPAYWNFTPHISGVNRETMVLVHAFALKHFKDRTLVKKKEEE